MIFAFSGDMNFVTVTKGVWRKTRTGLLRKYDDGPWTFYHSGREVIGWLKIRIHVAAFLESRRRAKRIDWQPVQELPKAYILPPSVADSDAERLNWLEQDRVRHIKALAQRVDLFPHESARALIDATRAESKTP